MRPSGNKTELKSFLGMAKFSGVLAEIERPLRELRKKPNTWFWDQEQQDVFESVKRVISTAPVLTKFSLGAKHRVTADSSSYALGAALL